MPDDVRSYEVVEPIKLTAVHGFQDPPDHGLGLLIGRRHRDFPSLPVSHPSHVQSGGPLSGQ